MGRKKRKVASTDDHEDDINNNEGLDNAATGLAIKQEQLLPFTENSDKDNSDDDDDDEDLFGSNDNAIDDIVGNDPSNINKHATTITTASTNTAGNNDNNSSIKVQSQQNLSSGYSMTSHRGDLITEDTTLYYVTSEDESDEIKIDLDDNIDAVELLLSGSRLGLMRANQNFLMQQQQQPNRQWVRGSSNKDNVASAASDGLVADKDENNAAGVDAQINGISNANVDNAAAIGDEMAVTPMDVLESLDPAQRAARLQQEKQRKHEQEQIQARRIEAEENAGRDPSLFSKRTAFDIRLDQIGGGNTGESTAAGDDAPWHRPGVDASDYFNYGLSEQDWLAYAQWQLQIRQELIDASRQKRHPDPNIVPVMPRKPRSQQPRVAVITTNNTDKQGQQQNIDAGDDQDDSDLPVLGPTMPENNNSSTGDATANLTSQYVTKIPSKLEKVDEMEVEEAPPPPINAGIGGAWDAGLEEDPYFRQLVEQQEQQQKARQFTTVHSSKKVPDYDHSAPSSHYEPNHNIQDDMSYNSSISGFSYSGGSSGRGGHTTAPSASPYGRGGGGGGRYPFSRGGGGGRGPPFGGGRNIGRGYYNEASGTAAAASTTTPVPSYDADSVSSGPPPPPPPPPPSHYQSSDHHYQHGRGRGSYAGRWDSNNSDSGRFGGRGRFGGGRGRGNFGGGPPSHYENNDFGRGRGRGRDDAYQRR